MNPQWRDFLLGRGAQETADGNLEFPAAGDTDPDCALVDLSHLGLILVRGEDAEGYLQGQVTNDIRELSATHTQLSSHCSQKGRMLANFRVMRLAEGIYLQLPQERVSEILKRLRLFVLRSKVTLEDASTGLVRFGIVGPCAPRQLIRLGLSLPELDGDLSTTDGVSVLRLPAPIPRFELIGSFDALSPLWESLASEARPTSPDLWALLDIRAGLPSIYDATADAFVPQMVNMQLIDGVSFSKGCYTGQEVVARMQYLGKLKRRMYLAEVESAKPPQPGDEIQGPFGTSEKATGRVVDARPIAEGRYLMLAVVEIDTAQNGELRLGGQGPTLRFEPPPYGLPAAG